MTQDVGTCGVLMIDVVETQRGGASDHLAVGSFTQRNAIVIRNKRDARFSPQIYPKRDLPGTFSLRLEFVAKMKITILLMSIDKIIQICNYLSCFRQDLGVSETDRIGKHWKADK